MIKGLLFFIKFAWKHEKRYPVCLVLNQFVSSIIPIVAVVAPRYIIDELMGAQRIKYLACYIGILVGYTFAASAASSWLGWMGFTYRIKVANEFNVFLHEKTVKSDYADLESSRYLEMREKANKFLFGNWKGFSYVLDRAVEIVGKTFTMIAVTAVVASLNPIMVAVFVGLVFISSYVDSRVQKKQADMMLELITTERRTVYYGQVLADFSYGKEIRINSLGDWLLGRERTHQEYSYETYKKKQRSRDKIRHIQLFHRLDPAGRFLRLPYHPIHRRAYHDRGFFDVRGRGRGFLGGDARAYAKYHRSRRIPEVLRRD